MVFLTSGWLRAWHETIGRDATVLFGQVRCDGQLLGAAAFQTSSDSPGVIEFAGKGPSDYADFIIHESVGEQLRGKIIAELLQLARRETPGFRHFKLGRLQPESKTPHAISAHAHGFHATAIGHVDAPFMDMCHVDDRLRKKSLRRHERGLERQGAVTADTLTTTNDILPLLDAFFFEQHVARWNSTDVGKPVHATGESGFLSRGDTTPRHDRPTAFHGDSIGRCANRGALRFPAGRPIHLVQALLRPGAREAVTGRGADQETAGARATGRRDRVRFHDWQRTVQVSLFIRRAAGVLPACYGFAIYCHGATRTGVGWADAKEAQRARSHGPYKLKAT